MRKLLLIFLLPLSFSMLNCNRQQADDLYKGFKNPPAEARPFVRWWWNGNRITEREIKRQLDVLHNAGIGGVEINPISLPDYEDFAGTKALEWLSPEWNRLLVLAAEEAGKKGMISDLIVGSGWPFGGEFLRKDETIQRVIINSLSCKGGDQITEDRASLLSKALSAQSRNQEGDALSNEILFICLVPESVSRASEIVDLMDNVDEGENFSFVVPAGNFEIIYGILQKGHRQVQNGAPGAAGPVMDHFRKEITLEYLGRLKKISDDTGIPLSKLFRALFCDSIELAGANWTDGFEEIFYQNYGYRLQPYLPFIFYDANSGYSKDNFNKSFSDETERVRYDYNKLLVRVFLDNFTKVFQDFCTENGVKCRYQAYGVPFLMGMMEGNMIPDIPESNNWIYSTDMDTDEWIWNQDHGYMIWNLYAASGGHLTGRKIISCEAMTNTRGVFKTSLEEIKRNDDMNFITGINHTVLHGYNYSPVEAGFPGWVRFGTYFSEKNTWWPYFSKWVDYNSRLSYVFQNTQPVKDIAVMGPTGDLWGEKGLTRQPFHTKPWYCYRLWETLSQSGASCEYIDEKIVVDSKKAKGELKYGPMSYQALLLTGIRSVEPQTARAIQDFVQNGGRLVLIDGHPERSLSYQDAAKNDSIVRYIFSEIIDKYPDNVINIKSPDKPEDLLKWTQNLLKRINIRQDVIIKDPDKNIFQIKQEDKERDIYFFVNSNRVKSVTINAIFQAGDKIPWIWDPEDGTRRLFPCGENKNDLTIELQPLQSMLLVFDTLAEGQAIDPVEIPGNNVVQEIGGSWKLNFHHIDGQSFGQEMEQLSEYGTSDNPVLNSFAGTILYSATFKSDGTGNWLELENVNRGITQVRLNNKPAGINWYGKPRFNIKGLLINGDNFLEIRYTSVLSNYVQSLKDNATARRWTNGYMKIAEGLEGKVRILN